MAKRIEDQVKKDIETYLKTGKLPKDYDVRYKKYREDQWNDMGGGLYRKHQNIQSKKKADSDFWEEMREQKFDPNGRARTRKYKDIIKSEEKDVLDL